MKPYHFRAQARRITPLIEAAHFDFKQQGERSTLTLNLMLGWE